MHFLQLPPKVIADVKGYRDRVARYHAGEISDIAFKAYRVPMGIYEQRETGSFMVRVRLGAGLATAAQLTGLADLAERYGNGTLHVTTRQDIQLHGVGLEDTVKVQEGLLQLDLAARGGGGNTVRNVSASPRAGVDPLEAFDVRPYALATAEYLLQFDSSYNLPRKYKIAFAGRGADEAFATVADLGLVATTLEHACGFTVLVGGGLGANPRTALRLIDWLPAVDCLIVAEAVKRVFDAEGDRANKHAARLRYVVKRLGEEAFRQRVMTAIDAVREEGLPGEVPTFREISRHCAGVAAPYGATDGTVLAEKDAGRYSLRLNLHLGDLTAADARRVAAVATTHGDGVIRTAQTQDLYLTGIGGPAVDVALAALATCGTDVVGRDRPAIVACAGASTCKLGLCLSRDLATAIVATGVTAVPPIRISGCPNSCGNHHIAALGFEGKARRIDGELMPHYEVLAGGAVGLDGARLGRRLGALPAKAIPAFITAAAETGDWSRETLARLMDRFMVLPDPVSADWFVDHGAREPFSLAGRGPGECSVGTMDIIRVDLDAARKALQDAGDKAVHAALLAAARALLPIHGDEPRTERAIFKAFTSRFIDPGWVDPGTANLIDAALDWKLGDRQSLTDLHLAVTALVDRVEELFKSLDAGLNFRTEKAVSGKADGAYQAQSHSDGVDPTITTADLRGVACPMNFVKAKVALESLPVGGLLDILLDDGEPIRNVPASFIAQGQEIVRQVTEGGHHRVRVKRMK